MVRTVDSLLAQQAALAAVGSFAFQENNLPRILNEAARICAASLGVSHSKICQYRPAENDLLIVAGFGWNDDVIGRVISQADESSPQGRAFVTGQPVIVRSLRGSNGFVPPAFYAEHGIVSTIDVIVQAKLGPPFGVLEIDNTREHAYDRHDIDFLTGFANILAEAVATANRTRALEAALTETEAAVREKDRLLSEMAVLAQELQHRVRNNLQLVNAMVAEQLSHTEDGAGQAGLRAIIQRVLVLARVYDHLLGAGMNANLNFGAYVESLCEALPDLQPLRALPVTLACRAQRVVLSLNYVTALGLIVSELVSNAYAHAFPGRAGVIAVDVGYNDGDDFGVLTVSDDGVGYVEPRESKRRGMGLVRNLAGQIGASVGMTATTGTTWTLRFPVAHPAPVA